MDKINKIKDFLKAQPSDCFLQHALALEYIKIGNDAEAKKLFENILEHSPEYVGSYYHLGKLLERQGQNNLAIDCYQKGMAVAKEAKDNHSFNELQMAAEDLED